jgi:hypothetical protein
MAISADRNGSDITIRYPVRSTLNVLRTTNSVIIKPKVKVTYAPALNARFRSVWFRTKLTTFQFMDKLFGML